MPAPPVTAYIRAHLRLIPSEAGGRRRPIASGYRCNYWLGGLTATGERAYNDAVVYLEESESLQPGEAKTVRIQPAFPDLWSDVDVGSAIDVCEGSRVVGNATVIELFPSP
jgi:hypothetical protein